MKNLFVLSLRNTLRNKRRTVIVEIMIVAGVVGMLIVPAILKSVSDHWRDEIVNADLGHFQVMAPGYKAKRFSFSLDDVVTKASTVAETIRRVPGVAGAARRIAVGGLVRKGDQASPFFGSGLDVQHAEETLPGLYNTLRKGNRLVPGEPLQVIIGDGLANNIGAAVGDRLTLTSYDRLHALRSLEVVVEGVSKIPDQAVNDRFVLMDYRAAERLAALNDAATEIIVRATSLAQAPEVSKAVGSALNSDLELHDWEDLAVGFTQLKAGFSAVSGIVNTILSIVVLIGLTNTVLMSVFERKAEIGTVMTLGASRRWILSSFTLESLFLAVGGAAAGILIHWLLVSRLASTGISLPPPPGTDIAIVIHPLFHLGDVLSAGVAIVFASAIAALYPSRLACRLNPIETLRSS